MTVCWNNWCIFINFSLNTASMRKLQMISPKNKVTVVVTRKSIKFYGTSSSFGIQKKINLRHCPLSFMKMPRLIDWLFDVPVSARDISRTSPFKNLNGVLEIVDDFWTPLPNIVRSLHASYEILLQDQLSALWESFMTHEACLSIAQVCAEAISQFCKIFYPKLLLGIHCLIILQSPVSCLPQFRGGG